MHHFLEQIFVELMGARVMVREEGHCPSMLLPQVFACFYDQLAPKAIALIAELARIPEVRQVVNCANKQKNKINIYFCRPPNVFNGISTRWTA